MTLDPEILPPLPFSSEELPPAPPVKHTEPGPGLLDTAAFFTIAICLVVGLQFASGILVLHWHFFGHDSLREIAQHPRFTIPVMGLSYGCILLLLLALFPRAWNQSFSDGVCWNFSTVRQHISKLILSGMILAGLIQLASNYLPVPKELPVDDFFRTPLDAWLVALFGTFIAPAFEELAFRGFLYPALRRWVGMVFAALLTSIPFALLHAQQLGHSLSPLAMVFLVSLVLTAIRQRTGSVAASALVHATYNLSIFLAVFFSSGGFEHLDRLKN